jgi:membrane protease YdiL (CAAX protease family)
MWLPELLVPAAEPVEVETGGALRRRRIVTAVTLVVGTGLLATTLRVRPTSGWFSVLGFLAAAAWIVGGLLSGPIALRPDRVAAWRTVALPAVAVGVVAFLGFLAADLAGQQLAWISGALSSILGKADAGPRALVLAVALVNGVAEEIFFRGALLAALQPRRPAVTATVIYVAVTAATGNLALVVAAVVMGTIFTLERLSTRSLLAPIATHLSWSTLTLLLLPR